MYRLEWHYEAGDYGIFVCKISEGHLSIAQHRNMIVDMSRCIKDAGAKYFTLISNEVGRQNRPSDALVLAQLEASDLLDKLKGIVQVISNSTDFYETTRLPERLGLPLKYAASFESALTYVLGTDRNPKTPLSVWESGNREHGNNGAESISKQSFDVVGARVLL